MPFGKKELQLFTIDLINFLEKPTYSPGVFLEETSPAGGSCMHDEAYLEMMSSCSHNNR